MPHIIIKLWPGRSEDQKKQMTDKIVRIIKNTTDAPVSSISVAIEEVPEDKWAEEVYKPDIIGKEHLLYKKPGYKCT